MTKNELEVEFLLSATPRQIVANGMPRGEQQLRYVARGFAKKHPKRVPVNRWLRRRVVMAQGRW